MTSHWTRLAILLHGIIFKLFSKQNTGGWNKNARLKEQSKRLVSTHEEEKGEAHRQHHKVATKTLPLGDDSLSPHFWGGYFTTL